MAYPTSRALASAIQQRARDGAGQTALNEFFAQRLISRLAISFPDQWALKGGQAMVARLPDVARTTRDIDGALVSTSRETAIAELDHAAKSAPADSDFLEFELVKSKPGYVDDLASLSFRVRFGGKVHGNVRLDVQVVHDRHVLGELVPLGRRVDPPKQNGWPDRVRVLPVPDHMAEKLVALYSVHAGRPSSRERDIVDLALLARYAPPPSGPLAPALRRALNRPMPPSVTVALPPRFVAPERFRRAFERESHGLSWETSMREIGAISAPALEMHSSARLRAEDASDS
ncbi:hypothetical protein CFK38_00215 [Brachybacterium vulturis]|uniref:Nucleotidyl transferase AbiEii/AbiGii toxin family protein n=1 Tax=Brachybacterium vulturis TaxID=2017484 RepID=A0A291GIF0_9MICO|nr:nucleotidyl transferase AbiEii/AbiGii toxin family protein [Brachybacterium vulturis]ATG50119.1 hypothetical protein CFK38_00215 [Brachybacterium vulturis]